jgi:prevent-host-death family protein
MTMNKVNIYEAKARLSEFIDAVERGERVVICRRNRPVAELRPIAAGRTAPRPIGAARGHVQIPAAFFDPLPNERVDDFYVGVSAPLAGASLVAERVPATRLSAMRRTRRQRRPRK